MRKDTQRHDFRTHKKNPETLNSQGFETNLESVREKIRTPDLLIRSQTLYPAELRAHKSSQRQYFITNNP